MIDIQTLLILVWMHFIIDFICQTRNIANNKHSNNIVLATHCAIYSLPFFYFGIIYALVNGVLHFGVDYVTSRINATIYKKTGRYDKVFDCVGIDQAIHLTILFSTYIWIVS